MAQSTESAHSQGSIKESSPHIVVTSTEEPEAARKLFVGGLSWQTTEDGLQHYFESMGLEVERVVIMRDKVTGRSRGFGFVTLTHSDSLDKAVNSALHLDGRRVEAKRAIPKREMEKTSRKLFVGGILISLTNNEFRKYFEQFGVVVESQVMAERETGRSRGFGFVTFQDEETTEKVLRMSHQIQGKPVEVKRAEPKKVERQPRPIAIVHPVSMPGMYYQAYPYAPVYGNPPIYGQHIAYDPAYFMTQADAVYAPQFLPIDDTIYEAQHMARPATRMAPPVKAVRGDESRASRRAVVGGPSRSRTVLEAVIPEVRAERAWSASLVPVDFSTLSLTERVSRNPADQRKRRGMSQPHPERSRRHGSINLSQASPTSRRPVTSMNWRTQRGIPTPIAATNPKEGQGSLHKYFQ